MIKNSFFETKVEKGFNAELTDTITNLKLSDFPDYYYMGYINYEDTPLSYNSSKVVLENDRYIFSSNRVANNYNFLILGNNLGSYSSSITYDNSIIKKGEDGTYKSELRFFNKLGIMNQGATIFDIGVRYYLRGNIGELMITFDNVKEIYDFIFNDSTKEIKIKGSITLQVHISDFENGVCKYNEDNENEVHLFINSYSFLYERSIKDSNQFPTPSPTLSIIYDTIDGEKEVFCSNSFNFLIFLGSQKSIDTSKNFNGYVNGSCTAEDILGLSSPYSYNGSINSYYHDDHLLLTRVDNNSTIWISSIFYPDDIKKIFLFNSIKYSDRGPLVYSPIYGYESGKTYAPLFNENNGFLGELSTGNLNNTETDKDFKDALRPWQYDVEQWSENDYTPDKLPEYDPNPDTPVTPDDWGDIPLGYLPSNATNAFVTYYLMDNVALSYLGQSLWHGLQKYDPKTNTNFIDNFFFIPKYEEGYEEPYKLDTALTLSSIIDYFPSLKYYPVPQLNTLARATVPFDYIYVGTSATQIPVVDESHPAQNYFVGRTLFTVDGGVITRNELLNQSKMFNNFLDYEPYTSCTLYVPYCGTIELQPSTIFDQNLVSLQLTYAMDIASGSMTAILVKNGVVNYPIAVAQGTIGFDIMLSGSNFTSQMVNAQLNQQVRANNVNKNLIGSFNTALGQAVNGNPAAMFTMSGAGAKAIYDTLNNNLSYPQSAGTSPISVGMTSSLAGCLQPSVAYIQVVKHSSPIVGQYGDIFGYTGNIMGTIGSQNGFFKAINPRLDGIPCNEYERDEIYNLLTSGVYWQ